MDKGRSPLPARRRALTVDLDHGGQRFAVTVGFDGSGQLREVFAGSQRVGAQIDHILADACVVISLALQFGASPSDLERSLGRVPALGIDGGPATAPASVVGTIVGALCRLAEELET